MVYAIAHMRWKTAGLEIQHENEWNHPNKWKCHKINFWLSYNISIQAVCFFLPTPSPDVHNARVLVKKSRYMHS
jgi:hypothetical protein